MATTERVGPIGIDEPAAYMNRELSWLAFARRVLALVTRPELPLLERMKFTGIMGMIHDEFFMKRISDMKDRMAEKAGPQNPDSLFPREEFDLSRREITAQMDELARTLRTELRPALAAEGIPIAEHDELGAAQKEALRKLFEATILPVLTPLAVDAEHPFPFISNQTLNLAVYVPTGRGRKDRFVRIKVPQNRPRFLPVPETGGVVPLEQVIAANLDSVFPGTKSRRVYFFRVIRGAEGHPERSAELKSEEALEEPGMILRVVSDDLKARRFAGCVALQVDERMPAADRTWLATQLDLTAEDIYPLDGLLGLSDMSKLPVEGRPQLRLVAHSPVTHPRLAHLDPEDPAAIFSEIAKGDILLHHPYHSFDNSVLRFLESAARDPATLAVKITIYRTSKDSPVVKALAEAARRGKQVAVLVEITARFDEAPNIAWGRYLESEGVHVAYGVESLKTHVKLALVVREEEGRVRRYVHVGTGNYHTGTARLYEDLGLLTVDPDICGDAARVFDALTGSTAITGYRKLMVAPTFLRDRFTALIRREAEHSRAGRPCGIHAKMNQLHDPMVIRELYLASQAGVPITLVVRGLCCLRPGVPGLSENIRVRSCIGRFLEHSRIYRFENGGSPEYFTGSADWMRRNLDRRVETITPVLDEQVKRELGEILEVYEKDNASIWEAQPDGTYVRRSPAEGEERREAQEVFIRRAAAQAASIGGQGPSAGDRTAARRQSKGLNGAAAHLASGLAPSFEDDEG